MGISENDKDRLLSLVVRNIKNIRAVQEFLNAREMDISFVCMHVKGEKDKYLFRIGTYITISYVYSLTNDTIYFDDNNNSAYISNSDKEFILSIIEKKTGHKMVYMTDYQSLFSGTMFLPNVSIGVEKRKYAGQLGLAIIVNNYRSYLLTDNNADFSDEAWNIIWSRKDVKKTLLEYYMDDPNHFSINIQKRIKNYYDSLSDGDKLLLEIGCD